ncbi:amidohydrolase [Glaciecola sp. XM2]|jgi:predicted amidohydrolase YtcJ|uniref:amidohydrolase n=1 Tax=Glaciecola sp. XM2 TaxID=1914931 RepID=UPI001BDF45D2|nr:amidohydrolase [Glaciecola sp. XM2]MBT1451111.1 amidohydrolase [Glaciecola sp. XM2]
MKLIYSLTLIISFLTLITPVDVGAASRVYTNATGYTLNSDGEMLAFSQLYIVDDIVQGVGHNLQVPNDVERIDMQNAVIIPGLIDAHGHILGLGENLFQVDLRGTTSEAEAVERIKNHISARGSQGNGWIMGRGWNQVLWDNKTFPSKESLDQAFPDTPVIMSRVDGHADWVNSKALAMAGINADTPQVTGGEIVKDDAGQPTGLLIDNASYLVYKLIPKLSTDGYKKRLNLAGQRLLSLGITSAHDAGITETVRNFYIQQANNNELDFRIYAMLSATEPNIERMLKEGHFNDEQGFLSIRSVKAYGDGALGSRGAALLEPYSDDPDNVGLLVTPEESLPMLFNTVIGANFQLNFHAIGDRANRLALQQFIKSFENFPQNVSRHRVEHAQVIAVEDIPLFAQHGIIPSMQPTHATSDMNMAEDRVGKERLKGAYAWQTFLAQGSRIAFGSDFPVELANPFHGLHAAVTRQQANSEPKGGWLAHEAVTRLQAFKGFTLDAAYSGFQEDMIGTLEVGKKADFIVIDTDIFEAAPAAIRDTQVLETWVNGELKYKR